MQRNSHPLPWRPRGLSDTLDATNTFAGAMSMLQNLVPDPTTKLLWQCRPAAIELINFNTSGGPFSSGFSSGFEVGLGNPGPVGLISALKVIGNFAYGMVSTQRFAGYDEPFCYNLLTGEVIAISGVTAHNTPASPATSGAWTPPTMALIGADLVVTHPGFTGANDVYFGVLNVSSPTAPKWTGNNLTGLIQFTTPPSAVAQFNGRAYYIQNVPSQPSVVFSDPLNATNCTNANQILTFGDNVALTALGGLPLQNQLGGIIQSLVVFKGVQNIYQITGDATQNDLTVNSLNITTGTLAPNTVVNTPKGLAFVSPDGVRQIDFFAHVSDPIGIDGMGVTVPFIYSVVPSRMAAACGGNVLRISVQNGNAAGSPNQEYWYDVSRQIWSGPHTFPMSLVQPYNGTFVGAPISVEGSLWQSDAAQSTESTFVENGAQMTWDWITPCLPDTEKMTNNAMTEATLDIALASTIPNVIVNALDQNDSVLNAVSIAAPGGPTIWGAFLWGAEPWLGEPTSLTPEQLAWTEPIVFTRMQLQATGQSATGVKLGAAHLRYQILRYTSNQVAA